MIDVDYKRDQRSLMKHTRTRLSSLLRYKLDTSTLFLVMITGT